MSESGQITEDMAVNQEGAGVSVDERTVGARLRASREAAGMSLEDVAQAIKYSVRQIELLEADNYAALPGNAIVRGFVRGYAKLLKLDERHLLGVLETAMPVRPADVRPPDNMGVAVQSRGLRELSPFASLTLVVFFAAILLALWHFWEPSPAHAPSPATPEQSVESVAAIMAPAGSASDKGGQAGQGGQGVALSPAVMPAPSAGGAERTAPGLKFVFAERSWVEVIDANRQVLHSGENPAGSELVLTGSAPFEMVIGNARKVSLTYDGRSIDLAPYTRAEVARLTLE